MSLEYPTETRQPLNYCSRWRYILAAALTKFLISTFMVEL